MFDYFIAITSFIGVLYGIKKGLESIDKLEK